MSKTVRLKYGSIDLQNFSDGRVRMDVQFYDSEMNRYIWTPAWGQVQEIFLKSNNTEQINKPRGRFVKQFAEIARQVFEDYNADIDDAELLEGYFISYEQKSLVIQYEALVNVNADLLFNLGPPKYQKRVVSKRVPVGFPVTQEFLRDWLKHRVRCLIVNGVAIELQDIDPGWHARSYPESESE